MTATWIKVCGITSIADAEAAILAGVSAIGLVMTPSPRQVTIETALDIARAARGRVEVVGVFREGGDAQSAHARVSFDRIQLHAREPLEASVPVLRAVPFEALDDHAPRPGEILVIDSSEGRGLPFDWTGLSGIPGPFVIAGGLNPENVAEAVLTAKPFGVDVSSGVEIAPGWKDPGKMTRFVDAVRRADERR
jgi:phosphoribosylanthranilate isomerase